MSPPGVSTFSRNSESSVVFLIQKLSLYSLESDDGSYPVSITDFAIVDLTALKKCGCLLAKCRCGQ